MPQEVQATRQYYGAKGTQRAVFRNPRGNKRYYVFSQQAAGTVEYEWSSDGSTWTNTPVTIDAGDSFDVKMLDDGSQLEVWVAIHTNTTILYKRGVIGDSSDTITWETTQTALSGVTSIFGGIHWVAIARTDNGRMVIAFTEDINTHGKDYRQTKLLGSDGDGAAPSWSGETTWDDPSADSNNQDKDLIWFGLENFGSTQGDRVLIYGNFPDAASTTADVTKSAVPDWAGSSFANTTSVDVRTQQATPFLSSAVIDEADIAHIVTMQEGGGTTSQSFKAGTAGDDNWGSAVTIASSHAANAITLTLDTGPATDELYCFYHDYSGGNDFNYKVSPVDTVAWGSEQTVTFGSSLVELTSWSRDVESGLHLSIEDGDTDIHYYEEDVSSGADTVGVTDTLSVIINYVVTETEAVGVTDVLALVGTYIRPVADSVDVTDTIAPSISFIRNFADSVGITDTQTL
jgi:hypothetical protein